MKMSLMIEPNSLNFPEALLSFICLSAMKVISRIISVNLHI